MKYISTVSFLRERTLIPLYLEIVLLSFPLEVYCQKDREIQDVRNVIHHVPIVLQVILAQIVARIVQRVVKPHVRAIALMAATLYVEEGVNILVEAHANMYRLVLLVVGVQGHVVHIVIRHAQWLVAKVVNHAA